MPSETPEPTEPERTPEATPLEDFFSTQIAIAAIIHDGKEARQTEPLTIDTVPVTIESDNVAAVTGDLRLALQLLMTQHKLTFPVTVRMNNTLLGQTHEFTVGAFVGIPKPEVPDAVDYVPPEAEQPTGE